MKAGEGRDHAEPVTRALPWASCLVVRRALCGSGVVVWVVCCVCDGRQGSGRSPKSQSSESIWPRRLAFFCHARCQIRKPMAHLRFITTFTTSTGTRTRGSSSRNRARDKTSQHKLPLRLQAHHHHPPRSSLPLASTGPGPSPSPLDTLTTAPWRPPPPPPRICRTRTSNC